MSHDAPVSTPNMQQPMSEAEKIEFLHRNCRARKCRQLIRTNVSVLQVLGQLREDEVLIWTISVDRVETLVEESLINTGFVDNKVPEAVVAFYAVTRHQVARLYATEPYELTHGL